MKSLSALVALSLSVLLLSASAAEPSKENQQRDQQMMALVKEVQAQHAAIADNQTKIDAKLVTIAEALRLARIYASRSGK
jgi:cytochrome c556